MLVNLLANARSYTPEGTVVRTSLGVEGDRAVLTVLDDGPGIPESLQPNLFQRFTRGDTARNRAAGSTGLGLSIVHGHAPPPIALAPFVVQHPARARRGGKGGS